MLQMEGDLVHRKRLEELRPESFTSILILADEAARLGLSGQLASLASHSSNTADSDSRSLASLLLLRDIQTQNMAKGERVLQGLLFAGPAGAQLDVLGAAFHVGAGEVCAGRPGGHTACGSGSL